MHSRHLLPLEHCVYGCDDAHTLPVTLCPLCFQTRARQVRVIDPDLRKGEWTEEEIALLDEAHAEFGDEWSKISQHLKKRGFNRADPDVQRRIKIRKPEVKAAGKERSKIKVCLLWEGPGDGDGGGRGGGGVCLCGGLRVHDRCILCGVPCTLPDTVATHYCCHYATRPRGWATSRIV
jgi:hypothetical protein